MDYVFVFLYWNRCRCRFVNHLRMLIWQFLRFWSINCNDSSIPIIWTWQKSFYCLLTERFYRGVKRFLQLRGDKFMFPFILFRFVFSLRKTFFWYFIISLAKRIHSQMIYGNFVRSYLHFYWFPVVNLLVFIFMVTLWLLCINYFVLKHFI